MMLKINGKNVKKIDVYLSKNITFLPAKDIFQHLGFGATLEIDNGRIFGWHSDAEKELQKEGAIASISLGAERKFVFKHRNTKEKVAIVLKHGSLLIMKNQTQNFWMHCLPPTKKILVPRINLTFRTIEEWVK